MEPTTTKSADRHPGKKVISILVSDKLARQLKLLSATSGKSAQAIVEAAIQEVVTRELGAALNAAQEDLKP